MEGRAAAVERIVWIDGRYADVGSRFEPLRVGVFIGVAATRWAGDGADSTGVAARDAARMVAGAGVGDARSRDRRRAAQRRRLRVRAPDRAELQLQDDHLARRRP